MKKFLEVTRNMECEENQKLMDEWVMNTIIITCGIVFPLFTYFELW